MAAAVSSVRGSAWKAFARAFAVSRLTLVPRYLPEPARADSPTSNTGVLLINLGTPASPAARDVRAYLREFLSDPRVVEIPRPIWWAVLNLLILPIRAGQSARRYAQIWTREGSPLKTHTARQAILLRGFLGERVKAHPHVEYAMRYGEPSIAFKLDTLKRAGCERILLLPLYPQYASSTTATAYDAASAALAKMRRQPALRTISDFHDDAGYISAIAQSIRDHWTKHGRADVLVLSFHGLPRYTADRGDPYYVQCLTTGRLIAESLALGPDRCRVAFQSRFGRTEWLKPYTAEVLTELGREKTQRVDVACPGFVADCLETLEEIAIEAKALFQKAGGGEFHYIPSLNERNQWLHALTDITLRNLSGWVHEESSRPTPH